MSKLITPLQLRGFCAFLSCLAAASVAFAQGQPRPLSAVVRPTPTSGVASSAAPPVASSSSSSSAAAASTARPAALATDREQDGLTGPVRRVRTETAKLVPSGGQPVESSRVLLEVAAYDVKGAKVDNAYYPSAGNALTGKEVYQYDDKGNITEMTLLGGDGALLSKEVYAYEFDGAGNWIKMTTSLAVLEGGKIKFEPSEITYRTITYYLGGAPTAGAAVTSSTVQPTTGAAASPSANRGEARTANNGAKNARSLAALPTASTAALDRTDLVRSADATFKNVAASNAAGGGLVALDAEPPARLVRRGPLRPVSGGVLNGTATSLPKPTYPEVAKRARSSGLVTVEVVVDEKGRVISARAVKGPALLHQAAETAASQARFSPTLLSGQAVKVTGIITYNFVYGTQ